MTTLTVKLVPSRVLKACFLIAHILAFISVWLAKIPSSITISLWSLIALSLCWQWLRYSDLRSSWFIKQVTRFEDGKWEITWGNDVRQSARLLESYLHPYVVMLHFATTGEWLRPTVIVFYDSAEGNDIRRLRGLLRTLGD